MTNSSNIKFNINNLIRVKLNKTGIDIYNKYIDNIELDAFAIYGDALEHDQNYIKRLFEPIRDKVGLDGELVTEFWEFCKIFGPTFQIGLNAICIDNSIEILQD